MSCLREVIGGCCALLANVIIVVFFPVCLVIFWIVCVPMYICFRIKFKKVNEIYIQDKQNDQFDCCLCSLLMFYVISLPVAFILLIIAIFFLPGYWLLCCFCSCLGGTNLYTDGDGNTFTVSFGKVPDWLVPVP